MYVNICIILNWISSRVQTILDNILKYRQDNIINNAEME